MSISREIADVLERFLLPGSAYQLHALGNAGGFSGARLWRVTTGEQQLCLRRWPEGHPDETRLRFIHAVMEFASMQVNFVPKLQRTHVGETAIRHGNHLWELTTWLPGIADYHLQPSPVKLSAALQALARIHLALELFPTRMTGTSTSPGLAERGQRLLELQRAIPQLRTSLREASAALRTRGDQILGYFERHATAVGNQLRDMAKVCVPLQPCLRDIWHDHVLFTGEVVTGIIDFDAVRIETVAGDLARLIGSLVGDNATQRHMAMAAYETLRPLSADETSLVEVFDSSSTLMTGMNWLTWLLIDGRQFPDMNRVYERIDETLERIRFREEQGLRNLRKQG